MPADAEQAGAQRAPTTKKANALLNQFIIWSLLLLLCGPVAAVFLRDWLGEGAPIVGFITFLLGALLVAKPLAAIGFASRWRGFGIATIGLIFSIFAFWLPNPHSADGQREIARRKEVAAEEASVREAVRVAQAQDREATRARQAAEREAAAAEVRRLELASLVARTPSLEPRNFRANAFHFRRLAELDPSNPSYIQQRDRYQKLVAEADTREREIRDQRTSPEKWVRLTNVNWSISGFGTVFVGNFTFQNPLSFAVKDFTVYCELYARSGTRLESVQETIYEIVEPGRTRQFRQINMGFISSQVGRASCDLLAARPAQ